MQLVEVRFVERVQQGSTDVWNSLAFKTSRTVFAADLRIVALTLDRYDVPETATLRILPSSGSDIEWQVLWDTRLDKGLT